MKKFYGGVLIRQIGDIFGAFLSDGTAIGMAGILREPTHFGTIFEDEGRWIGFLDVTDDLKRIGSRAIRTMRTYLKGQHNKEIIVLCDENNFPDAGRLLKIIGFVKTDASEVDPRSKKKVQVWKWQHLH